MSYFEYKYISAVAECASIQKAADQLFITPSTLSRYIASCQKKYNVKLFSYVDKKMYLTEAGEMYLDRMKLISDMYEDMNREMLDIANYYGGKIRIGMPLNYNSEVLNQAIVSFKSIYPFITISITKGDDNRITQKLLQGDEDVLFDSPLNVNPIFIVEPIFEEELVLAVPKNSIFFKEAVIKDIFQYPWIDVSQLENQSFISTHNDENQEITSNSFVKKIKPMIRVTTTREAYHCVNQGLGISVVYAHKMQENLNNVQLLSFGDAPVKRVHTITYRKDMFFDEPIKKFIDIYKNLYN